MQFVLFLFPACPSRLNCKADLSGSATSCSRSDWSSPRARLLPELDPLNDGMDCPMRIQDALVNVEMFDWQSAFERSRGLYQSQQPVQVGPTSHPSQCQVRAEVSCLLRDIAVCTDCFNFLLERCESCRVPLNAAPEYSRVAEVRKPAKALQE